jgi:hypothetical protein
VSKITPSLSSSHLVHNLLNFSTGLVRRFPCQTQIDALIHFGLTIPALIACQNKPLYLS